MSPEEVLATYSETGAAGNNLQRGLILCGIGLGLILCFGFLADWSVGAIWAYSTLYRSGQTTDLETRPEKMLKMMPQTLTQSA